MGKGAQKGGQKPTKWRPSAKQTDFIVAASKLGHGRSISAICKEARVSRDSFYRWMDEDADFQRYWEKLPFQIIRHQLPGIVSSLVKQAQDRDVAAARLSMDALGILRQKHEITGRLTLEELVAGANDPNAEEEQEEAAPGPQRSPEDEEDDE